MGNQYQRGANVERELENSLWERGWATFRTAGSGSVPHASADLVAIREVRKGVTLVLVMEVKYIDKEEGKVDVRDNSEQLMEIDDRVNSISSIRNVISGNNQNTVSTIFVFRYVDSPLWYYTSQSTKWIDPDKEYNNFIKLLRELEDGS